MTYNWVPDGAMPWLLGAQAAKTPAEQSLSKIKWRRSEPTHEAAAAELASAAGAPAPISQPVQQREPAGAPAAPSSSAAAQGGAGPGAPAHSVEKAASGASCHAGSHVQSRAQPGFGVLVLPGRRAEDHGECSRAEDQGADWYARAEGVQSSAGVLHRADSARVLHRAGKLDGEEARRGKGRSRRFGDGKDAAADASCGSGTCAILGRCICGGGKTREHTKKVRAKPPTSSMGSMSL